ncbi:hypothetical protein APHAL10511_005076 [Amanita phalloides]|nr:hypothetical protein APHAL10511_005076 [Amanita phalloides]
MLALFVVLVHLVLVAAAGSHPRHRKVGNCLLYLFEILPRTGHSAPSAQPPMVSVPLENTEKLVWTVMVSIENVKFKVLVDTGSSGLWVLSSECKNPEFVEKSKYVPKNLPEQNPETFNLEYINTRVEGVVHSDTVTIGSIRLDNHYFGGATKVESHCRLEGILGLPPTISTVHGPSFINHPDFLREAIEQRKISPKFSINLASPNPRLHLGGIDHRGYTGPIEYHKVVAGGKHWILENCHLTIQQAGHQRTTHTVQLLGRRSLIDTGATAIYGHPEVVKGFCIQS